MIEGAVGIRGRSQDHKRWARNPTLQKGFRAWMCACTQGFVQALPAKAGVFGDLRHASRFNHLAVRPIVFAYFAKKGG